MNPFVLRFADGTIFFVGLGLVLAADGAIDGIRRIVGGEIPLG